jgi:hypothetical protein
LRGKIGYYFSHMLAFVDAVQEMGRSGRWDLPLPGAGETPRRLLMLSQIARRDLAAARIAEAHSDAIAILAEAGAPARVDTLYGVWTTDSPEQPVRAERIADLGWRLHGVKRSCCGARLVSAALVSASAEDSVLLFDVAMDEHVQPQPAEWHTPALAETATCAVSFDTVVIGPESAIGRPDWYLRRAGFWNGTVGPAACWAGGALSLIDAAREFKPKNRDARAHVGAMEACAWQLGAMLDQCGREIDADPEDLSGRARVRALMVRHLIERGCTEVLERFGRATSDHLLVHDERVAKQYAALTLCIRQCQTERDLETIPEPD